jgi:hypothetical protein
MVSLRNFNWGKSKNGGPDPSRQGEILFALTTFLFVAGVLYLALGEVAFAEGTKLPGADASDQLQAAGTLLRIIDTGLFKWGARIFAGICIMSSGWALKEQRFAIAIICVVGAIIFGTAPTWVKNIFDIGGGNGVFSKIDAIPNHPLAYRISSPTEGRPHV